MRPGLLLPFASALLAATAHAQAIEPSTHVLDFGTVVADGPAEQVFTLTNRGDSQVRIRDVQLTPPLTITRMKSLLEPGQRTEIAVRLGAPRPFGEFEGRLTVNFTGESMEPLALDAHANVVPGIELRPRAELVAVTTRGSEARDSIEIVNHMKEPLQIAGAATSNERYSTSLETVEPGRLYRLTLVVSGQGLGGTRTDTISLKTGSAGQPVLDVGVRTLLRERVYTFPDRLDLGRIAIATATATATAPARPDASGRPEHSLMVYQKSGEDFEIEVSTDVPFLVLRPEKSAKFGDRWQIYTSIDPAKLTTGRTSGTLTIETNDPEFPRIVVPVEAHVE